MSTYFIFFYYVPADWDWRFSRLAETGCKESLEKSKAVSDGGCRGDCDVGDCLTWWVVCQGHILTPLN